jgi:uncharacterized protein
MSSAMRHLGGMLLLLTAFGCERRADEPEPRPPIVTVPARELAPSETVEPAGPPSPPPRCIDPTPTEPKRLPPAPGPDAACPADPGRPELRWGEVIVGEHRLEVEIATDPAHRERGLMYRRSLPAAQGMLFVFDEPRIHTFWMKNTCIPLDMLFIDRDGVIVGIEENVPTMNTRTYAVRCPSLYVLEVNAGWCRRHGVRAGQRVRFEGIGP